MDQTIFVVETCQNCNEHGWNTRHDENKYADFFKRMAAAIIARLPDAVVMKNQIPKHYLDFEIYNNLIPNEDPSTPFYQQVPRLGALEVSFKGMLIFSKIKGSYWPTSDVVADKCPQAARQSGQGKRSDHSLDGVGRNKAGGAETSGPDKTLHSGTRPGGGGQ